MAKLTGITQIFSGDTTAVDTILNHPLGTHAVDVDGNEYIYLTGVGSTVLGSWVTYDELGITALLAANAKGPVAVAMAIIDSTSKYGWYCIFGTVEAKIAASSDADTCIGREGADGVCGDGRATGDEIIGAMERDATTSAAVATVQLFYPLVNDKTGS